MNDITLLPADNYMVLVKSIITDFDKNNLVSLYEPIIGPIATSLYMALLRDAKYLEMISDTYTHHHLVTRLKVELSDIKKARESLEAVGLIQTFYKKGETTNEYVYEIYSPLSPREFFNSPIFNITLYNNLGKSEYERIKKEYEIPKIDMKEYSNISKKLNVIYKSDPNIETFETRERRNGSPSLDELVDFDMLTNAMPNYIVNDNLFNKKVKKLINELAFIYNFDTNRMIDIVRDTITDKGIVDKEALRKNARKYYEYNNNFNLPSLVYKTQPEYLKESLGDKSPISQIIYMFENTSPIDYLTIKNKGVKPTSRDIKIIESLAMDLNLKPAVINVLIDYVLRKNNNKLNKDYIESIASQWQRLGIETAKEAMEQARKENSKKVKASSAQPVRKKVEQIEPSWFNKDIKKEEMSAEELKELEEAFKEFR